MSKAYLASVSYECSECRQLMIYKDFPEVTMECESEGCKNYGIRFYVPTFELVEVNSKDAS